VIAATTDLREEHAMTQQRKRNTSLEKLNDTGLSLADSSQDIRNRKVIDRHGEEIGHVSDLFIDQDERKVRMLEIRAGGFLGIGDRHVHVNQTGERIAHSPTYDPTLIVDAPAQQFWEPYYGYYGLSPYWGAGYMYPEFPPSRERPITD
jgi:sporulation protein YlmC with PRC-barrel domain